MGTGKHWGSFGKGFIDALLAVYRMQMTQDLYDARKAHWAAQEAYWASIGLNKNAIQRGIAEQTRLGHDAFLAGGGKGANAQQEEPGAASKGSYSMQQMVEMAQKAGFQGEDAAHMAALAYAESKGNPGAVGGAGEIGLTQINPHAWGAEMAAKARDPQGAFDMAKIVYDKQGWGAWSTDPSSAHFTPGNSGMRFINAARKFIAPSETAARPITTERVSAKSSDVKAGWEKIVNPQTPAEDKAAEAYKFAHPDWMEEYRAGTPPEPPGRSSQADLPPGNQLAGGDDSIAMQVALDQQRKTLPTPPGGSAADQTVTADQLKPPLEADYAPRPAYERYPDSTMYPQPGPGTPQTTRGPGSDASAPLAPPPPPVASLQHPISKPYPLPYESGYPEPPATAVAGTPAEANKPSADAQPVAAVTPQSNQAIPSNPRFVPIYQPNIARTGNAQGGRGGDNNAPMMGALNLSWGANPPLNQPSARSSNITLASSQGDRAGQTVSAPTPPPRPSDNGVGTSDMAALDDTTFDTTAARKGGPMRPAIPRYAQGGGVMGFAAGGGAPTAAQLSNPGWQNTASTYTTGPDSAPLTNQQLYDLQNTINSQPAGMFMGSYSDWLTGANNSQNPAGASRDLTNYYGAYAMPAPAAAAPAAATTTAPTTTAVSTPTTVSTTSDAASGGTTTGAYQLPDVVAPTTTSDTADNTTTTTTTPALNTPTTIVPNITTSGGGVGIDQNTTTTKPLNTPSTTGTGGTGTSDVGNTNYKDVSNKTGAYAGFSRGGIPRRPTLGRYAGGGGVMGYAAGATVTSQQVQTALDNALYGPNAPYSRNDILYGRPDKTVGDMMTANINALSPNQQDWYNAQTAALGGYQGAMQAQSASYTAPTGERGGQAPTVNQGQLALAGNQLSYYQGLFDPNMPAAPAAAAAATDTTPAAATPAATVTPTLTAVSTPTVTSTTSDAATGGTTTGAYQLPDIVAPTSTPSTDQTGTTVNATPKVPTTTVSNTPSNTNASDIGATDNTKKQNTGGTTAGDVSASSGAYAGFHRGGVTRRVTGYDFGGDVGGGQSPAPAGMLPGLGGTGQPIPPIYYNPATYAGAGAPVGKGVTSTSAPTYVAGAIPTLPMFRGGRVQRYDDGGEVQQPDPSVGMDQVALNDDTRDDAIDQNIQQSNAAANAPPAQGADGMPAFTGYFSPTEGQDQADPSRPPGLAPYAAQVSDGNGNLSHGFVAALVGGIHWLADHLGVAGGAQAAGIAPDAQAQQNRQMYVSRANMMTRDDRQMLNNAANPHQTLDEYSANIAGMEQAYRWLLWRGDINDANKMAASILQYDVANANDYQEEAAKRYYDGDLPGAVKAINAAADAVPSGQRFHAELAPDGKNLIITGSDLLGRELWKQVAAPAALLSAVNPSMPWTMLENSASKYDPTFKAMAAARRASQEGSAEEDLTKQMYAGATGGGPEPTGRGGQDGFAVPPGPEPHPTLIQAQTAPPAPQAPQPAIAPAPQMFKPPANMPPVVAQDNAARGGTGGGAMTDTSGVASTPAQPIGADQAGGPGPAIAQGPGPGPAIAPGPGPMPLASQAAADDMNKYVAANVPAEGRVQEVNDNDIIAAQRAKYFDDQGHFRGGPEVLPRPDTFPQFFQLSPAGRKGAWESYGKSYQARQAWEAEQQKQFGLDVQGARDRARAEAATLRTGESERYRTAATLAGEGWKEKQANLRNERSIEAAKTAADTVEERAQKARDEALALSQQQPMRPEDVDKEIAAGPGAMPGLAAGTTLGALGWYVASPHYGMDMHGNPIDVKIAAQKMGTDLATKDPKDNTFKGGVARMNELNNALPITKGYNPHVPVGEIADILLGAALDKYDFASAVDNNGKPMRISLKHDPKTGAALDDGFDERYPIRFTRRDDGSGRTLVVTADDYNAIHKIMSDMRAKNNPPVTTTPAMPPMPTGPGQTNANDLMLPGIQ